MNIFGSQKNPFLLKSCLTLYSVKDLQNPFLLGGFLPLLCSEISSIHKLLHLLEIVQPEIIQFEALVHIRLSINLIALEWIRKFLLLFVQNVFFLECRRAKIIVCSFMFCIQDYSCSKFWCRIRMSNYLVTDFYFLMVVLFYFSVWCHVGSVANYTSTYFVCNSCS